MKTKNKGGAYAIVGGVFFLIGAVWIVFFIMISVYASSLFVFFDEFSYIYYSYRTFFIFASIFCFFAIALFTRIKSLVLVSACAYSGFYLKYHILPHFSKDTIFYVDKTPSDVILFAASLFMIAVVFLSILELGLVQYICYLPAFLLLIGWLLDHYYNRYIFYFGFDLITNYIEIIALFMAGLWCGFSISAF